MSRDIQSLQNEKESAEKNLEKVQTELSAKADFIAELKQQIIVLQTKLEQVPDTDTNAPSQTSGNLKADNQTAHAESEHLTRINELEKEKEDLIKTNQDANITI